MKTVTEMAQSVGAVDQDLLDRHTEYVVFTNIQLERFAELVRADEREQGQKWFDAVTAQHKQAILAEREACSRARAAKPRELRPVGLGTLLGEQQYCFEKGWREGAASVRNAIRARGNT